MYVKNVEIENVKSFRKPEKFTLKDGVNFLVGDNNSGKSTLLEAILFLFEGPSATRWTPDEFYAKDAQGPTRVVADISGGVEYLVQKEKFKKRADFGVDDAGENVVRL